MALKRRKKVLEAQADAAATTVMVDLEDKLPELLADLKKDFEAKVKALNTEFGVVDGRYPAGVTLSHPVAKEYERRYDALKQELHLASTDAETMPTLRYNEIHNDFPGLQEVYDQLEKLGARLSGLFMEARAEPLKKLKEAEKALKAVEEPFERLFELLDE